jgi:hypothetical protein
MFWNKTREKQTTSVKLEGCLAEPDDDGKCKHLVPRHTCYFCLTNTEPTPCGDDIEKPDSFGDSGVFKNA